MKIGQFLIATFFSTLAMVSAGALMYFDSAFAGDFEILWYLRMLALFFLVGGFGTPAVFVHSLIVGRERRLAGVGPLSGIIDEPLDARARRTWDATAFMSLWFALMVPLGFIGMAIIWALGKVFA